MGRLYEATMGRAFAAWYGRMMGRVDDLGLRETRRAVLGGARGRVLEVGSGIGSNLPLYPDGVERLVLAEPGPHMLRRLRRAVPPGTEVVQAPAERLPFADDSFDCVTCTLVLCTVPDPAAGLAEIARVLAPGGRLLFLEHVRSGEPRVARLQDRLERPWRFLGDGCHCNRDTLATIAASRLTVERVEHGELPSAPSFVRPLIHGSAVLA